MSNLHERPNSGELSYRPSILLLLSIAVFSIFGIGVVGILGVLGAQKLANQIELVAYLMVFIPVILMPVVIVMIYVFTSLLIDYFGFRNAGQVKGGEH